MKSASFLIAPLLVLLAACSTDPKVICKKYVDNGNKYFDRGKYKEASILYRRALNKDMRYADAWYRLGLTNLKLALLGEARKDFSRAMEVNPGNLDAMVQVGNLDLAFYLLDRSSNKALLADLRDLTQQLLKKDPRSFDGLRFSGNLALIENDLRTAIGKLQEANLVQPFQPELVRTLVETLFADHQDAQAEKLARDLIGREKTYAPIYDVLYVRYVRGNQPELGEQLLQQKIANNPTEGAYRIQLALHYYRTGRRTDMQGALAELTSNSRTFPEGRLQAGDFYVRIRELDAALDQYQQGEKENPGGEQRLYRKKQVEVLATQGKLDQAGKIVAALLKQDPKDQEAIALHATLLLESGDAGQIKAALAQLQPLAAKLPANATLHFNLGRAYLAAGPPAPNQARQQFQEALEIDPNYEPAKLALAELQLAGSESVQAVVATSEVLARDPANLAARLIRARGLTNLQEPERARQDLTTALQMDPASGDARYQLAQLDFRQRRYKEAESGFQALVEANDPRGITGVLQAKVAQGQSRQAVRFAQDQVQRSPSRSSYRMALAQVYAAVGQFAEGAAEYQTLIDQQPKSADLFVRMGEAKLQGQDFPGAQAAFQTAQSLAPNDPTPCLDLALLYDRTVRPADARKEYENVIRLQPDNSTALNNLAYLEAEQGVDLDQALAHARRAAQKLANDPNVMDTLGLIYIKKNLTDDGLRMLREVVKRKPESAAFHLHLALALYQKGDRPTARKELQTALRNRPSDKERGQIKELLAKVG
jgi:tetratricopeptide (TPR) repeat protein